MGLRMKNFNIFDFCWKIRFLRGLTKNQYRGGLPKKRDLDSLQILGGGLGKKEGVAFLRVSCYTQMHTMVSSKHEGPPT